MKTLPTSLILALGLVALGPRPVHAWDYEGHRVVNQLALAALPKEFPAFVKKRAASERIAFLAGEPDRWRNSFSDRLPLAHYSGPDHYFDLEELDDYGIKPEALPIFRYDLTAQLGLIRAKDPAKFHVPDPEKNKDHTRELPGFAPWAITEYCGKLKSAFSYLKAYQNHGGTREEIANAEANIIYMMGVMGHYVGDCAQPLHVTKHHHGWVGPNPKNYATTNGIHSWIDGGYFRKTGGIKADKLKAKIRPAKIVGDPTKPDDLFRQVVAYLQETHKEMEPLYILTNEGKLTGDGAKGLEGRAFLEGQIVKGGQMLGDLWYSSWQQATEDTFLVKQLKERKGLNGGKK